MGAYGLRREQNIDLLVKTALEYGVTDRRQLAYIVATAQHESDNFATAREYDGRNQAIARGYDGGANYYGRGYVQVTHRDNYESMARVLRDARIARDPDIVAREPRLGAETTVVGMVRGLYTGVAIGQYINDERADYVAARAVVNGNDRDRHIASLARDWERNIDDVITRVSRNGIEGRAMPGSPMANGSLQSGEQGPEVYRLQQALVRQGANIRPDGEFGAGTRSAVVDWQREHGVARTGVADTAMLQELGVQPQRGQTIPPPSRRHSLFETGATHHADRALLDNLSRSVRELDQVAGKDWDESSQRLCASAFVMAKLCGFNANDDLRLSFNQQTERNAAGDLLHLFRRGANASTNPADNRTHMAMSEALSLPVEDRLQQALEMDRVRQGQQEQQEMQRAEQAVRGTEAAAR